MDWETRFWSRVDCSGGEDACWIWTGCLYPYGYGQARMPDGTRDATHRITLRLSGVEPRGFYVHHHCGVPACVNPRHLELMTPGDHTRLHVQIWNRENVLEAFTHCANLLRRVPSMTDWNTALAKRLGHPEKAELFYQNRWPTSNTVRQVYGSWNNLVRTAGFTPRAVGEYDRSKT